MHNDLFARKGLRICDCVQCSHEVNFGFAAMRTQSFLRVMIAVGRFNLVKSMLNQLESRCTLKGSRVKSLLCGIVLVAVLPASGQAQDSAKVEVAQLVKASSSWDSSALPAYGKGKPEVTILRVTIPPGARLPPHKHPVINAGVVLSGELTVETDEGKTLRVGAGKAFVEVVDRWHYGRNDGDVPVVIVAFYAGTVGTPISVTK
jgi:quercetin dioxygenase-like cupin family protein